MEITGPMAVSAAQFVRHFARYRDEAHARPVYISHHGRRTHVLCNLANFENLTRANDEVSLAPDRNDPAGSPVLQLADWSEEAVLICDNALRIVFANRQARTILGRAEATLVGKTLTTALPALSGTLFEVHARRTAGTREPSTADIPSPWRDEAWLRFRSFPLADQIALSFRDITPKVEQQRTADWRETIKRAITLQGEVGYVRVSERSLIMSANEPFRRLLGVPHERLVEKPFTDIVASSDRQHTREALERVHRGLSHKKFESRVLTNDGAHVRLTIATVRLAGVYGAQGAVMVFALPPNEAVATEES